MASGTTSSRGVPGHDRSGPRVPIPAHAVLQSGESAERGRAARRTTPRWAHGDWAPAPDRPDPIAVLKAQATSRVQELVPIRYGKMLVSPFTVYRGAAAVMAADLAATPVSGIVAQACGDAHISRRLVTACVREYREGMRGFAPRATSRSGTTV